MSSKNWFARKRESIFETTRSEQYRTADELFEKSQATSVYYLPLLLSAIIVSIGLLLENVAIVIGGVMVSPMLTPILTTALGVVVGRFGAIRYQLELLARSTVFIILLNVAFAFLFGAPEKGFLFGNDLQAALLYFVVAAASGMASTFAWARKEMVELLPGLAMAVVLIPPLSLLGIWLAFLEIELARYFATVFILNLIGVFLGSFSVFALLKFHKIEKKVEQLGEEQEEAVEKEKEEKEKEKKQKSE